MIRKVAQILCVLALFNFLAFVGIGMCIGGDALNGTVRNGRCFLRGKGQETEVSEGVWRYSRIHAMSALTTLPLAMILGLVAGVFPPRAGVTSSRTFHSNGAACQVCRAAIVGDGCACATCGARHHRECWDGGHRCT